MAGIGFELRKLLKDRTYANIVEAYGYAGILGSGPWIISIIGIIGINFLKYPENISPSSIVQFQVSITYIIALSLIFSSIAQHGFTRYVADVLFDKRADKIMPNFNGMLLLMTLCAGVLGAALVGFLLPNEAFAYKVLCGSTFVVLCDIWFVANLLSGLKTYKTLCFIFFAGYATAIIVGYSFSLYGLSGLMVGFFCGQFVILLGLNFSLYGSYSSDRLIEFDFLKPNKMFLSLVFASLFYNLGIWADKFIFWYMPTTGHEIIGRMNCSPIYDVPIFLAFITIVPGMAIFLFYMETDFSDYYDKYYAAVREGATLEQIISYRYSLVASAKNGIYSVVKIQAVVVFLIFALGEYIVSWLNISSYYLYLLNINVISASLLVIFLSLLNIAFYLDKRAWALILSALFFAGNCLFTFVTLHLGVFYFGYGFMASLMVVCVVGASLLNHAFDQLEYEAFTKYEN